MHAPGLELPAVLAVPAWLCLAGIALFSGSIVTPIGGLFLLAGWALIAWNAFLIVD